MYKNIDFLYDKNFLNNQNYIISNKYKLNVKTALLYNTDYSLKPTYTNNLRINLIDIPELNTTKNDYLDSIYNIGYFSKYFLRNKKSGLYFLSLFSIIFILSLNLLLFLFSIFGFFQYSFLLFISLFNIFILFLNFIFYYSKYLKFKGINIYIYLNKNEVFYLIEKKSIEKPRKKSIKT